jgi:hypothetical protein
VAIEFRTGGAAALAVVLVSLAGCTVERSGTGSPEGSTPPGTSRSSSTEDDDWVASEDNQDPSENIDGVEITEYEPLHAEPGQRVAYEKAPPDGGRHDPVWADCNGTVYPEPVRNEHMVHSLEHGSVWIAYDPERIEGADLDALAERVDGQPFMLMSPYPGLDEPISLQAWGHQLRLADPDDVRIDQFIKALRQNQYTSPEPGARCDSQGTGFDATNPPPFEEGPPGPDAAPVGEN